MITSNPRKRGEIKLEYYKSHTQKELSQRKIEAFQQYSKAISLGRKNPVWFAEFFYGIKLMDYQKWCFMESWDKPFVMWLACRAFGKTVGAAIFLQTKMVLIPNYKVYISTNSANQSIEVFKKIEDLALNRIPSFRTLTDIFSNEIVKGQNTETGFLHNPSGHSFRLYNNSELLTLSTNIEALRGKRGSVLFDETGWQNAEQMATIENFINVDADFGLGASKNPRNEPKQMPLQLMYISSASDVSYPFYEKYKTFSKKIFLGDNNYFVCDINVNDLLNYSSVDGEPIKSHISQNQINKAIEDDPDLAERELFNKFRKGTGQNPVVRMDTIIQNSEARIPLLYNDTGKKKFILCFDPARNCDNSILAVFQKMCDKENGYWLRVENVISMTDISSKGKTPLTMPEQLKIIKNTMIKYNGEKAFEWENIELFVDSGSGGGGISAVCDQLMDDWFDEDNNKHRGIIDPVHKQYATARDKYVNAAPIVTLIDPQGYKKIIYDSLEKLTKANLIKFPEYDNKDYILIKNKDDRFEEYSLSGEEQSALQQIHLMKNEVIYICKYENPNGGVTYDLERSRKNTMHDDRAYVLAMAAYALAKLRRDDLIKPDENENIAHIPSLVNSISF